MERLLDLLKASGARIHDTARRRPLLVLLRKAYEQLGLFGEKKDVQQPGSRGGKFYFTKESHHVRYGQQPTLVLKVDQQPQAKEAEPVKEEKTEPAHQKERYEMTQAEYLATKPTAKKKYLLLTKPIETAKGRQMMMTVYETIHRPGEQFSTARAAHIAGHRALIEQAMQEGKRPPAEVLKDYPDLGEMRETQQEKKPHEMTRDEWARWNLEGVHTKLHGMNPPTVGGWRQKTDEEALAFYARTHKGIVQRALERGEDVPSAVLAQYPDLHLTRKVPKNVLKSQRLVLVRRAA